MTSPFVFNIARLADFEQRVQTGPSPTRIGPEMIGITDGSAVSVDATLTQLGGGVLADATITAQLQGQCVRCLADLNPPVELRVQQVFAGSPDFITGAADEEDTETEDLPEIVGDEIDLLQAVIDEAGLALPFNPQCEGGCEATDTPAPDGVSGEDQPVDLRWADLEKFL